MVLYLGGRHVSDKTNTVTNEFTDQYITLPPSGKVAKGWMRVLPEVRSLTFGTAEGPHPPFGHLLPTGEGC